MFTLIKNFFTRLQSRPTYPVSFVVFGIGNKGEQYSNTRHNIGFSVIDALLEKCEEITRKRQCSSDVVIGRLPGGRIAAIAKPQTFVNRSGTAIKQLLSRYDLPLSSCLVVVDDLNLPLGILRLRRRGSDGGHKGLRSIIAETSNDFPRLRIGIGPLPEDINTTDFVLSCFDEHEIEKRNEGVKKSVDSVIFFCNNGIDAAMNTFNK